MDLNFILESLDRAVKEHRNRENGNLTINSFKYFIPILKDYWKMKNMKIDRRENYGNDSRRSKSNNEQSPKFNKESFYFQG
jgi:hypothetical protein